MPGISNDSFLDFVVEANKLQVGGVNECVGWRVNAGKGWKDVIRRRLKMEERGDRDGHSDIWKYWSGESDEKPSRLWEWNHSGISDEDTGMFVLFYPPTLSITLRSAIEYQAEDSSRLRIRKPNLIART